MHAVVDREHSIGRISKKGDCGGKIDIIVRDSQSKAIIIENKIYAEDQKNQLLRYYNYGERYYADNYRLFYLTFEGTYPSECATSGKCLNHINLSYREHIINWLENCMQIAGIPPTVCETIRQYITNMKDLLNMMNNESKEQLVELATSPDYIQATLAVLSNQQDIKTQIRKAFIGQLKTMGRELGYEVDADEEICWLNRRGNCWISFHKPEISSKWGFYVGYEKMNSNQGALCGISGDLFGQKDKLPKYKLRELYNRQVWKEGEPDGEWPLGWNYLYSGSGVPESGRWWDWDNINTLTDMVNGKLTSFISRQLDMIEKRRLIELVEDIDQGSLGEY